MFWWTLLILYIIKMAPSTTSDIEHMVMPKYGPWLWTKNSDKQLVITADLKGYPIQCKGTGKTRLKPLMRLTQTVNFFFPRRSFFSWQSVQVGTDLLLCFIVASSPTQLKEATHSRWLPSLSLICSVGGNLTHVLLNTTNLMHNEDGSLYNNWY